MREIVAGKNDNSSSNSNSSNSNGNDSSNSNTGSNYVRLPTRIEDAHHYKSLAERLQSMVEDVKRIR